VNGVAPIESETTAQLGSFGSLTNFGSITSVTRHLSNPYTQNYTLGLQYQLGAKTALSADYFGSVSRKLTDLGPINSVASPPAAPQTLAQEQACIGVPSAPGPCTIASNNEYGPGNNRIDPRFDQVDMLAATGGSNYNALALQLKQHASTDGRFRLPILTPDLWTTIPTTTWRKSAMKRATPRDRVRRSTGWSMVRRTST
jgi:hypothetical protein